MQSVYLLILGLASGVLGGLFGIGGGILIVPVLVALFGFSQLKAQGTSLVALLAPVGLFGLMRYHQTGNADLRAGALIAAGFLAGAFFGGKIATGLDDQLMRKVFAVFIIAVGLYLLATQAPTPPAPVP